MDKICSMIGIALIVMLALSLCKDYKMNMTPRGTTCSMASHQSVGVSAKAASTDDTQSLEGISESDNTNPIDLGPLTESGWNMNKELTASEKATGEVLDGILNVNDQESFEKQMTQSSCNTSKHTYEKIIKGQSVMRPEMQGPTHSKTLGTTGLLDVVLTVKEGGRKRIKPTEGLWFNESSARADALKE